MFKFYITSPRSEQGSCFCPSQRAVSAISRGAAGRTSDTSGRRKYRWRPLLFLSGYPMLAMRRIVDLLPKYDTMSSHQPPPEEPRR